MTPTAGFSLRPMAAGERAWRALGQSRTIILVLAGYCLLHYLLRLGLNPIFSLDESEQMLFSQDLKWGYRFRHPPLITWMVHLTQATFGLNRWSFFAVKYVTMFGGLLALFLAARIMLKDARLAGIATFSYGLTYIIGWYPHADLMHTVLLTSLIAACLHAFTRVLSEGRPLDYAYLGAAIGFGTLSKYVFLLFPAAAGIAIALVPAMRARIKLVPLGLALLLAVLILTPYGIWIATYDYSLTGLASEMTKAEGKGLSIGGILSGTWSLAYALVEFTLPMSLILTALCPILLLRIGARVSPAGQAIGLADWKRFLEISMLVGALFMAAAIFAGATYFKSRWMHQVLLVFPLYLFVRLAFHEIPWGRLKVLMVITLVVSLGVVGARIAQDALDAQSCRKCRADLPIAAWAKDLRDAGFTGGTIATDDYHLGGNLRYALRGSRVVATTFPLMVFPEAGNGQCLVVWMGGEATMPEALETFLTRDLEAAPPSLAATGSSTHGLRNAPDRLRTLHYALYPDGLGNCR